MDKNFLLGFVEFSENNPSNGTFASSFCPICGGSGFCSCIPNQTLYGVWEPI